jgi:hypothetical protein
LAALWPKLAEPSLDSEAIMRQSNRLIDIRNEAKHVCGIALGGLKLAQRSDKGRLDAAAEGEHRTLFSGLEQDTSLEDEPRTVQVLWSQHDYSDGACR